MNINTYRQCYLAPHSEIVEIEVKSTFMEGSPYSATYTFGETGVEEGGVI